MDAQGYYLTEHRNGEVWEVVEVICCSRLISDYLCLLALEGLEAWKVEEVVLERPSLELTFVVLDLKVQMWTLIWARSDDEDYELVPVRPRQNQ